MKGILIRHPYNFNLYWSHEEWKDPNYVIKEYPGRFKFIGEPGWYGSEKCKEFYKNIIETIGYDAIPQYPGEYIILSEWI